MSGVKGRGPPTAPAMEKISATDPETGDLSGRRNFALDVTLAASGSS
jgi:hypothetical protein